MKSIKLTQNKAALVSPEDFDAISAVKWGASCSWKRNGIEKWYAKRWRPVSEPGKGRHIYMHRMVMCRMLLDRGEDPEAAMQGMVIDHGDGNGLNNTRENLWLVSSRENMEREPGWVRKGE